MKVAKSKFKKIPLICLLAVEVACSDVHWGSGDEGEGFEMEEKPCKSWSGWLEEGFMP